MKRAKWCAASAGEEVAADSVAVGCRILVRPGDKVAIDGVVRAGASTVDQSMLTGEAALIKKKPGDQVSNMHLPV